MNKGLAMTLALLALAAAVAMYIVGGNNGHLTELRDFFWVPLPLAALFFLLGMKGK